MVLLISVRGMTDDTIYCKFLTEVDQARRDDLGGARGDPVGMLAAGARHVP
jgi:hypothetical protein